MSLRSATKEDVSKTGFLYVRNTTTQEITKIATSSDFQVGLIKESANLTITGNTTLSGDLAVNSGNITTAATTFNLINEASTINLGSTAVARTINIGTGAAAQTILMGSTTGASSLTLSAGSGNMSLSGVGATNYTIGSATTTGVITIGGTAQTGTAGISIVLGQSTASNTIQIGDGALGGAATQTIAIGTNAANTGTGTISITVGSTTAASGLTLQAGTGNIVLSGDNSTTYTIGATSTTGTITIGRSTDTNTINIGNGATASSKTQTINVGNSTASSGITNINIGASSAGTNTITIGKYGSGLVNVILGGDEIKIGDNAASDVGFFGTTPQPKTSVADIVNNITAGGTANTLTNYTSLTTYSTDAATIRNNFYQIGLKLNAILDALQSYGLI